MPRSVRGAADCSAQASTVSPSFDPPQRLRLIYLPSSALPPADTVMVDDFILESAPRGTIVRLLGSGISQAPKWDTQYRRLRTGWQQALHRLKIFVEQRHTRTGAPP